MSFRALAFLCLLLVPFAASASQGPIRSGILLDANGAQLAGVKITLRSTDGKVEYSAATSTAGRFSFPKLDPGDYLLTVVSGKVEYSAAAPLHFGDNGPVTLQLRLSNSGSVYRVLIGDASSVTEASGGEHLSSGEVSSLPLNSRDFSKLLLLAAGTMTDSNGAANFTQQFAVNGQRGSATVFAVDGADTTDPEMGGATFSNFNVDGIQEVQGNAGVMSADIGHGAASYTNVVTKSGTDQVHGSFFEFVRNASFDARNYFDPSPALMHRRIPPFVRNEFGVTNGGPLVLPGIYNGRRRTYYFAEYQGFRQVLGTTQVFPVPTAAERQGIDTTTYPGDTLNVPVDPAVSSILAGYPLPNTPNGAFGPRTYAASSKVSTVTDQFSARIDHRISDKAGLLTRFSLNQVTGPTTNPDQTAINPDFAVQFFDHQRNAEVKYVRTINPHFTSETSFGYIRSTPFFPAINKTQPAINFGDSQFAGFNTAGGSIFGSYSNLYQLKQDMTAVHGSHALKWGVEVRANRDSTIYGVNTNGSYSFGGDVVYSTVFIPSASGSHNIQPGDPFKDSLLGLLRATPFSYSTMAAAPLTPIGNRFNEAGVRREAYNFYFMDTWKTNSRLSLTYGLRYELNNQIHEAEKRTSTMQFLDAKGRPASYLDHTAQQIFVVNPQPPYNQEWSGFGPRLGVDYSLPANTVLHAGASLTSLLPNLWQDNFLTGGLPFIYPSFLGAQAGVPVPFSSSVVTQQVPAAYSITGQPIFPAVLAGKLPANTILDVNRLQSDIDAQTPGNEVQLSPAGGIARDFRYGYVGTYTLGVDHDFHDFKFNAAYVATVGIHLARVYFPNGYGGASPAFAPYTQFDSSGNVIGGYGAENVMTSGSHSTYHALQTSLTKNSARAGLGVQLSYTFSKSIDDTSAVVGGPTGSGGTILQSVPQNPWDPSAEKAPSTFDVTHVFATSFIQLLPLQKVSFLRPLGKTITSGWQFLNVTTLMTGSPFTVFSGQRQSAAGSGGGDRPDMVAMPHLSISRPVREDYFGRGTNNSNFFLIPSGRFGTLGRNTFRGPGFHNFDVALIKDTPFGRRGNGELGTVEFRAEFFNIFNIVNFGLPNNVRSGTGFGLISKTAGSSRQIQFSLKLIY